MFNQRGAKITIFLSVLQANCICILRHFSLRFLLKKVYFGVNVSIYYLNSQEFVVTCSRLYNRDKHVYHSLHFDLPIHADKIEHLDWDHLSTKRSTFVTYETS